MDIKSVITEEDFESIRFLNYNQLCRFLMNLVKLSVEESLKALPHVMSHLSKQTDYLKSLSVNFYTDNKDLASNKPLVAKIIEQTEAKNPGKPYEKILETAAEKAREIISKMDTKQVSSNNKLKEL